MSKEDKLSKRLLINQGILLEAKLSNIPKQPGCYIMLDYNNTPIYVGKSKYLKNRVKSYFRNQEKHTPRIKLMVSQISDIEFIVTDNENEALTLESNLIKTHKPYYNILLKDDKKYPYICITWSEKYPRLFLTRKRSALNSKDRLYGPFVDVNLARNTLALIKRVFPLRQRSRPLFKDRTCLNHSIGRCPGVCQEEISPEDYQKTLKKVAMVFQGRTEELKNILLTQMKELSENMQYELAAKVRDQLKNLDKLQEDQKMIIPGSTLSRDVVALASNGKIAAVQIFQMRNGKLVNRLGYTSDSYGVEDNKLLQRVLEEHYTNVDSVEIPKEVLVETKLSNHSFLEEWLTEKRGRRVSLLVPKIGTKTAIVELVKKNSKIELDRIEKGIELHQIALDDLSQLLDLDNLPRRIEAFDISHIQGSDPVASQVVFIDGIPAKQHYRRYKIKSREVTLGHSDDYSSMAEVITRRFKRWSEIKLHAQDFEALKKTKQGVLTSEVITDWPCLVVIDGGKGQLSTVFEALSKLGLEQEVNLCSIAKKHEEIFVIGSKKPLNTNKDQEGVVLLRKLRDEAHRFAINFHRKLRTDRMKRSRLTDIPGLGPKRRRLIMEHFKSVESVQIASIEQIKSIPSLGNKVAEDIWNYFHPEASE